MKRKRKLTPVEAQLLYFEKLKRPLTPEEKTRLLDALAEENRFDPPPPPEAFNRENI